MPRKKKGEVTGRLKGGGLFADLAVQMVSHGMADDIARARDDLGFRKEMYEKFGIKQQTVKKEAGRLLFSASGIFAY